MKNLRVKIKLNGHCPSCAEKITATIRGEIRIYKQEQAFDNMKQERLFICCPSCRTMIGCLDNRNC